MTDFERWHEVPEAVRLVRLRDLLATGQPWTARQLAERMGVSVRCIQRDVLAIDAMLLGLDRSAGANREAIYRQAPDPRPHGRAQSSEQRRRAERLMAVRDLLAEPSTYSTAQLARVFGVTRRIMRRDLLDIDTCLMPLHRNHDSWRKATF